MKRMLVMPLLLLACMAADTQPATRPDPAREAKIRKAVADGEKIRLAELSKFQQSLSGELSATDATAVRERIKKLQGMRGSYLPMLGDFNVGGMGRLWPFTILQVADKNNMLIRPTNNPDMPMWIENYSTEGMMDGKEVTTDQAFEIVGTKQYKTLTGQKTVLLLHPLDLAATHPR